jgi:hypothetical protein
MMKNGFNAVRQMIHHEVLELTKAHEVSFRFESRFVGFVVLRAFVIKAAQLGRAT